jgi:transcriptional regulator
MYIPSYFALNEAKAFDLIEAHNFGTLVSMRNVAPFATHLPMLLDRESRTLWGHIARGNPQWQNIEGQTLLAMFLGDHHYISPTWYESEGHVPTWNYSAVHVYGRATIDADPSYSLKMLEQLIRKHELPDSKYSVKDLSSENLNSLLSGIVGFTIAIERIEGKSKMSQNHPARRREGVIEHLRELRSDAAEAVADQMQSNGR